MEADFGGGFHMEADSGGIFQYGDGFLLEGGRFFLLVKAWPVILCHRSTTRGGLYLIRRLAFVPRLSTQRKISSIMLFFKCFKFRYNST
jgi:hypothetical protein